MSIDSLAHADSAELLAMFYSEIEEVAHEWRRDSAELLAMLEDQEFKREMDRLADLAEASTPDPRPEDFYYEDGPRAYAH